WATICSSPAGRPASSKLSGKGQTRSPSCAPFREMATSSRLPNRVIERLWPGFYSALTGHFYEITKRVLFRSIYLLAALAAREALGGGYPTCCRTHSSSNSSL